MHDDPILVLDTASPVVSVAIGCDGRIVAQRTLELRRSSEMLLQAVDEALDEAGVTRVELGAVAASRGPGSFTGLRIGLATAIGLHQALGLPATGLDGRRLLARAAAEAFSSGRMAADPEAADSAAVVAVDALRGEWSSQRFRLGPAPEALERAQLRSGDELLALDLPIVGFG
ncbi:MAG: tRNA (adenosine(37)-N6)-threonylcarbamoyltransferase complex dimerization subunit type 1 TsaB, partial [Acidobacteriota bacterium]